jgi:hypothetical protein
MSGLLFLLFLFLSLLGNVQANAYHCANSFSFPDIQRSWLGKQSLSMATDTPAKFETTLSYSRMGELEVSNRW